MEGINRNKELNFQRLKNKNFTRNKSTIDNYNRTPAPGSPP